MSIYSNMLDDIHQCLSRQFKVNNDARNAQKLEEFFNYIIYRRPTNVFDQILTKEIADTIRRQNSFLVEAFQTSGSTYWQTGLKGELAFANLIKRTVEAVAGQPRGSISDTIVSGQQLTTVVNNFSNDMIEKINLGIQKEIQAADYTYYQPKQQKTDIRGLSVNFTLSPEAQWLLELSATVKNYHSKAITLGSASNKKILQSTLYASDIDTNKKLLYMKQLFEKRSIRIKNSLERQHLNHIRQIYELTGFGQIEVSADGNLLGLAKQPKYLMINQIGQRIVIRSTSQLVQEILSNGGSTRIGAGKTIKYYLD